MKRFSVYKHNFELPSGVIARRQVIILKEDDGSVIFTNFGKYIKGHSTVKTPSDDGGNQFYFIVNLLNHAFGVCGITKLDDLTVEIARDFLQAYATGTLDENDSRRTKETVNMCVNAVMSYMTNLAKEVPTKYKIEDLYRTEYYKDKYNEVQERKVPVFDVIIDVRNKQILRDMPNKVFSLFLNFITEKYPELLGLVVLQAFAGLRPSEACNVRMEDSPLGSGIIVSKIGNKVKNIEIDIEREINLRSDNKRVGNIKKERKAAVPAVFRESFMEGYIKYLKYRENQKCEEEYKPLSLNISGKARTYYSYYQTFQSIIKNEFTPLCLKSNDEDVVAYGMLLLENKLSPHAFRHWYSVQLTLAGYSAPELMHARGDKSITSALTYIENKGELEKTYEKVSNEIFDYFAWVADSKHGN